MRIGNTALIHGFGACMEFFSVSRGRSNLAKFIRSAREATVTKNRGEETGGVNTSSIHFIQAAKLPRKIGPLLGENIHD